MSWSTYTPENEPLLKQGASGKPSSDVSFEHIASRISDIISLTTQLESNGKLIGSNRDSQQLRQSIKQQRVDASAAAKSLTEVFKSKSRTSQFTDADKVRYQKLFNQFTQAVQQLQKVLEFCDRQDRSIALATPSDPYRYGSPSGFGDNQPSQSPQQQTKFDSLAQLNVHLIDSDEHDRRLVAERNAEIKQVAQDLLILKELFTDVQQMVNEQGEELRIAEENVITADIEIQQGVDQLKQASSLKASARRKKIWIVVCVLVILVLVGVILALVFSLN